jgi:SNF2 family DNA or RNA helicase
MNSIIQLDPGIDKITEGTLYPHQSDGVAFLLSKKRAILANDVGLGKTRQAIVAVENLVATFERMGIKVKRDRKTKGETSHD